MAAKMVGERPAACGNLFHLSWPAQAAAKTGTRPAAILEFDAQGREGMGTPVTIRRMPEEDFLVLTNHFCIRSKALACERFAHITEGIHKLSENGSLIDLLGAKKILMGGESNLMVTAHTLVFLPDSRTMQVAISRGGVPSTRMKGSSYTLESLLRPAPEGNVAERP